MYLPSQVIQNPLSDVLIFNASGNLHRTPAACSGSVGSKNEVGRLLEIVGLVYLGLKKLTCQYLFKA